MGTYWFVQLGFSSFSCATYILYRGCVVVLLGQNLTVNQSLVINSRNFSSFVCESSSFGMFLFQFSAVSSGGTLVEIEINAKGNICVILNGTRENFRVYKFCTEYYYFSLRIHRNWKLTSWPSLLLMKKNKGCGSLKITTNMPPKWILKLF